MRFAHLSDSHLGHRQYSLDEREDDFYEVFSKNVDKIIDLEVDFVIHSGDLFDVAKPSPRALLNFQREFLRLKDNNIPVYAIAGNHETMMKKSFLPPQILFRDLGLKLLSFNKSAYQQGGILICGVPFRPNSQKDGLLEYYKKFEQYAEKYPKAILVAHQAIDKYLTYENSYELTLDDLPKNFDYYAMGHLHNYINEPFGKGRLVYPGSMENWKSSEVANGNQFGKGFVVVDITPDEPVVERIKIDLPRKFLVEKVEYKDLRTEVPIIHEKIKKLDKPPILEITVEKGDFNNSEVYEYLNETFSRDVLSLRPKYKPDSIDIADGPIGEGELNPESLIYNRVKEGYGEDAGRLSIDLLKNLSKNEREYAESIAEDYYNKNYNNDLKEANNKQSKLDNDLEDVKDSSAEEYKDSSSDELKDSSDEYKDSSSDELKDSSDEYKDSSSDELKDSSDEYKDSSSDELNQEEENSNMITLDNFRKGAK